MTSYKPIDLSKEGFRKYLDRKGVLDAMTKVLIKCNTERPENAMQYLMDNLCETHVNLKTELHEAHQEIERLKQELSALKIDNGAKKSSVEAVANQETKTNTTPQSSADVAQVNGGDGGSPVNEPSKQESVVVPTPAAEQTDTVEPKPVPKLTNGVPAAEVAANEPTEENDLPTAK